MPIKNHSGEVKTTIYIDAITKNRLAKVSPPGSSFKQSILLACKDYIDKHYDSYLVRMRKEKEFSNKLDVLDVVEKGA